jgi:hypothetical protein
VFVGLSLSMFVPWLAEHFGYLEKTMWVDGGKLVISAPMLGSDAAILGAIALWTPALVLIAIFTTQALRIAERASRRLVRLQAWRLGQLVPPADGGTAP